MEKVDRDLKQQEACNLWLESSRKNTLVLGTGFGKSRVTMLILEQLMSEKLLPDKPKILLLSNSENLRDVNWKEEFENWNYAYMWQHIVSECYQTSYKWENTNWDLIIADEIDFALTGEYSKVFLNNTYSMLLGLTGYVDPSKQELLNSIAPTLITYTTQDAQNDGILNKTQVVLVEYELSQEKTMKVEYKKGGVKKSFMQSENDAYDYIEERCNVTWGKIDRLRNDMDVIMGLDSVKISELKKLEYQYKMFIIQRKAILYKSVAAANTAQHLITQVLKHPNNKILTFSMYTEQADKVNKITYHGKNKDVNSSALDDLSSGKIRTLGVCKAVNRGKNLVGVNNLIMESYDGSKTQFTQRHGRGCRLNPDQTMYLYILLPFYRKLVNSPDVKGAKVRVRRPTQMVKWATEMTSDFNFGKLMKLTKGPGEMTGYEIIEKLIGDGFIVRLGDDDFVISNKLYRESEALKPITPVESKPLDIPLVQTGSPEELLKRFIADCRIPFRAKGPQGNFYQLNGMSQYAMKAFYSIISKKEYSYEDMVTACSNYYNNTKMSRVTLHNFFANKVFEGVMEDYLQNKEKYRQYPMTPDQAYQSPTNKVSL